MLQTPVRAEAIISVGPLEGNVTIPDPEITLAEIVK
jgi:hypothetical protein